MSRWIVCSVLTVVLSACGHDLDGGRGSCAAKPATSSWAPGSRVTFLTDAALVDEAARAAAQWNAALGDVGADVRVEVVEGDPSIDATRHGDGVNRIELLPLAHDEDGQTTTIRAGGHIAEADVAVTDLAIAREALIHEIGHALGLNHSEDRGAAMFCYALGTQDVTPVDVAALASTYQ